MWAISDLFMTNRKSSLLSSILQSMPAQFQVPQAICLFDPPNNSRLLLVFIAHVLNLEHQRARDPCERVVGGGAQKGLRLHARENAKKKMSGVLDLEHQRARDPCSVSSGKEPKKDSDCTYEWTQTKTRIQIKEM